MLRFFRRIRQSLFSQNRFGKYALYAIGEIILVVIGILIALSINNWNQNRQNRNYELDYYLKFKNQLVEDHGEISGNIKYNDQRLRLFRKAVEIIEENNRSRLDTLTKATIELVRYSDLHRPTNIYESLVNSGQVKLFTNQGIIDGIQQLETTYVYIDKLESSHFEVIKEFFIPVIIANIKVNSMEPLDPENMYRTEFQNMFALLIELMDEKNDVYNQALDQINGTITLIDQETEGYEPAE